MQRPSIHFKHYRSTFVMNSRPLKQRQKFWSFSQWKNSCLISTLVTPTCSGHCYLSRCFLETNSWSNQQHSNWPYVSLMLHLDQQ
ncbi:hypothetical protein ACS0TY_033858 [Phlomoides rotata]